MIQAGSSPARSIKDVRVNMHAKLNRPAVVHHLDQSSLADLVSHSTSRTQNFNFGAMTWNFNEKDQAIDVDDVATGG